MDLHICCEHALAAFSFVSSQPQTTYTYSWNCVSVNELAAVVVSIRRWSNSASDEYRLALVALHINRARILINIIRLLTFV